MTRNTCMLVLSLTILVAGTASGYPQGWFSGVLGIKKPVTEAPETNVITTTTTTTTTPAPLHKIATLTDDLKQNADNVVSHLGAMKDEGIKVMAETKEKIGGIVEGLKSVASGKSIQQFTSEIAKRKEELVKIGEEFQSIIQSRAGKSINERLKIISDKSSQILGELGSTLAGIGGGQVMSDIGQHIGKAVDEINKMIGGESVRKIIGTINTISGTLNNAMGDISKAVMGKGDKPMGEYIGGIGKSVGSAMSEVATMVAVESGKKMVNDIRAQVNNAVSQVNSIVQKDPIGKLTSMASKIGGEFGQATGEVKSFVTNANFNDALDIIKSNPQAVELATKYGGALLGKIMG